ncbi:MAG: NAAT family transporter [Gammaproteobacteria bacterium]|nr:NAAT family transporter [Gammaproteobacteria bacterium]
MDNIYSYTATVFMGFFAIMNPIANTPIFIGLTSGDDRATAKKIALKSITLAFLVISVFSVAGKLIFELFGITLPPFHITGGILIFLIGFQMLHGEQSSVHNPSEEDNQKSLEAQLSIAVSPLAVPILAGPGTIATAMNFVAGGSLIHISITLICFALLCLITYGFFISGERFINFIGESTLKVITRMMGLILAVIGTQMVIKGLVGSIKLFW